jgi:[NiFe] hydrogenase assembly HybE family chaperone
MSDAAHTLQQVFEAIHRKRMQDMPMVNPALQVATIGFEKTDYGCLGILLTPWCMNLVLLPEGEEWNTLPPGSKQLHTLPSGEYEFVIADESGIGRFQSCSLFSPMFEFNDQVTAISTAEAALSAVMNEVNAEQPSAGQSLSRKPDAPDLAERARRPMSRRDFLRGGMFR